MENIMGIEIDIDAYTPSLYVSICGAAGIVFTVIFILLKKLSHSRLQSLKETVAHRSKLGWDLLKYEIMHLMVHTWIPSFQKHGKNFFSVYMSTMLHKIDHGFLGILAMSGLTQYSADFMHIFCGGSFDGILDNFKQWLQEEEDRLREIVEEDATESSDEHVREMMKADREKEAPKNSQSSDVENSLRKQSIPDIKMSDTEDQMVFAIIGCAEPEHFMEIYGPFLDEFCAKALQTWSSEKTAFAKMKIYKMTEESFQEMAEERAECLKQSETEEGVQVTSKNEEQPMSQESVQEIEEEKTKDLKQPEAEEDTQIASNNEHKTMMQQSFREMEEEKAKDLKQPETEDDIQVACNHEEHTMTQESFQEMVEEKTEWLKQPETEEDIQVTSNHEQQTKQDPGIVQDECSEENDDILMNQEVLEVPEQDSPSVEIQRKMKQCNKASEMQKEKQKNWTETPEKEYPDVLQLLL